MGNVFSFAWEDKLIIFIQKFMSAIPVKIAGIITEFGDAVVLVAVIGLFYWALNKELGKKLLVNLSLINIVNPCIKCLVKRLRPYMANPDIKCLKPVDPEGDIYDVTTQDYSFPSGHAANSMAVYGLLGKENLKNDRKHKSWTVGLFILTLLVGVSRFALGVHYPTDVLVGWLVACICVALYTQLEKRLGRYKTYIILYIVGLAGFFFATTNDFYTGYGMLLGGTLGVMFEEKFVKFQETRKPLWAILRTAVGVVLFLGLDTLFKLPFSREFLNSGTTPAFIVRAARYAIVIFLLLGVYPFAFGWKKKK